MIIVGIGSNLPGIGGDSQSMARIAMTELDRGEVQVIARSRLWKTAPVPASDQPWYVNAVVVVATRLKPIDLLLYLHAIEADHGRQRVMVNAARSLDLDIIDYEGQVSRPGSIPVLPHPRMAGRAFVLKPMAEICPSWRHPITGTSIDALISALPASQIAVPVDE